MTTTKIPFAKKVIDSSKILDIQKFNRKIYADEKITNYVTDIVQATRKPEEFDLDMNGFIQYGVSPRASIWMILGGKAHALLEGRGFVKPEDIKAIAPDVLRHRIILTYEAEAEEKTPDDLIKSILKEVPTP